MDYESICRISGKLLGGWMKSDPEDEDDAKFKEVLEFLRVDITPKDVKAAAYVVPAFLSILIISSIALLTPFVGFMPVMLIFLGIPFLLFQYLKKYPLVKARSVRQEAIRLIPDTMFYLIMSLRINPNLERALEFTSKYSKGVIKRELDIIIHRVRMGVDSVESGLVRWGETWGEDFDEFRGSVRLVLASNLETNEKKRQATLDKASNLLLDGLNKKVETAARKLHTPTMILFTFGVILPLVFVALVPFMSLMGLNIGIEAIALMYVVAIPLMLFVMTKFIVSTRPITSPPPNVPIPSKTLISAIPSIGTAALFSLIGVMVLMGRINLGNLSNLPFLWAFATAVGLFLFLSSLKVKKARSVVKKTEMEFSETLHQLGIFLSEGRSLEDALDRTAEKSGKLMAFMRRAANNIRMFSSDIRAAFFHHEFGALKDMHSDLVKSILEVITSIANKGSNMISLVSFSLSEQTKKMQQIDTQIEQSLGSLVTSMKIIAIVVGPLVGGMISSMSLVLAATMDYAEGANMAFGSSGAPLDPAAITLIIGIFVVESSAILSLFAAGLIHGDDWVMKRNSIGLAMSLSVFIFTGCAWLAAQLFTGLAGA